MSPQPRLLSEKNVQPEEALLPKCILSEHLNTPPSTSRPRMQSNILVPEILPKALPRWHYKGNYGTGHLPGGRECVLLYGIEMSLLFRERRFREEDKIGGFFSSQISISLLCASNKMTRGRTHRLVSCCISVKTNGFSNQIPWT